jgi:HSP20 family protein
MAQMQREMDRFFDDAWRSLNRDGEMVSSLALDVHEDDRAFYVEAAVPGVPSDALNVNVQDNVLTISGESRRTNEQKDEKGRVLMLERSYGKFSRSIRLPAAVQEDNIEAVLEDGVLKLTLPKTPEVQPRRIEVKPRAALTQGS